ncbi:MAG: response regulator [Pseudomonadota bacterium]
MCKALIIDDEDAICRLIIYALARNDIDADIATDSSEGITKFEQEDFDVVITDMLMPGVDGNGIAQHIRNSAKPATPIIGISGTSWLIDQHHFNAVFEKPFPIHLLVDTVKNLTNIPLDTLAVAKS